MRELVEKANILAMGYLQKKFVIITKDLFVCLSMIETETVPRVVLSNLNGTEMKNLWPKLYERLQMNKTEKILMGSILHTKKQHAYLGILYQNGKGFFFDFKRSKFWETFEFKTEYLILSSDTDALLLISVDYNGLLVGRANFEKAFTGVTLMIDEHHLKMCKVGHSIYVPSVFYSCDYGGTFVNWSISIGFTLTDSVYLINVQYVYILSRKSLMEDGLNQSFPYQQMYFEDFFYYKNTTVQTTLYTDNIHTMTNHNRIKGTSRYGIHFFPYPTSTSNSLIYNFHFQTH